MSPRVVWICDSFINCCDVPKNLSPSSSVLQVAAPCLSFSRTCVFWPSPCKNRRSCTPVDFICVFLTVALQNRRQIGVVTIAHCSLTLLPSFVDRECLPRESRLVRQPSPAKDHLLLPELADGHGGALFQKKNPNCQSISCLAP